MTRAALYARFSTDLQNASSAEDQLAHLRKAVEAKGWSVVAVYKDEAMSGAHLKTRPGVVQLLTEAEKGRFDVVVAEALDRLSRDQADTAHVFKTLTFHGVQLFTTTEGTVTSMHVAIGGFANQHFLTQLAEKTRRGQIANVMAGKSGGGRCYGYRIVDAVYEIEPGEADVVRRIFAEYDRGASPRTIAARLNADTVPGPRGGEWTAASINGDRRVGDGILHQPLYNGELVFNRRRYRKHPETGRRTSIINDPVDWLRQPMPQLRIVDGALWNRVQARKAELSAQPATYARRPKRLLSGLMVCATCGGLMTLQGRGRYACSAHRERGTCSNEKIISAEAIEQRVLAGVRDALLAPALIEEAMRAYERELAAQRASLVAQRAKLENELNTVEGRFNRLLDLYLSGTITKEAFKDRSDGLEGRRARLKEELSTFDQPSTYTVHPRAVERYRSLINELEACLLPGMTPRPPGTPSGAS